MSQPIPLNYPLEQLLTIKKNRFAQALKILEEKKEILLKEEKKLKKVEAERDEVLNHKKEKLNQLREELDEGTTTDKIQQMKQYLEVVDDKLVIKQKKVDQQKEAVVAAEKQVELAKQEMFQKQKDLEKLKSHKKEWQKEVKFWSARQQGILQDELGSAQYITRKKEHEIYERKKKKNE